MSANAPKITLFHSELARLGPVTVTVETDVTPSKYPGKPAWVMLKLDGMSRRYDTENPACAAAFSGMRGLTVSLTATGSREQAAITIHGPGQVAPQGQQPQQGYAQQPQQQPYRPPTQAQHPQQQPPQQQQPQQPPPQAPEQPRHGAANPVVHCKRELNKIANGYLFCLAAGEYVRTEWDKGHPDRPMTDEQFQAVVSTVFIAADRRMLFTDIPTGSIENIG